MCPIYLILTRFPASLGDGAGVAIMKICRHIRITI
jgi:hypothetical protein